MKVTIIIPCYNASAYIASSISSIQSQTLTDWEMIIVDDGSTDGSALICDEYEKKDFHKNRFSGNSPDHAFQHVGHGTGTAGCGF